MSKTYQPKTSYEVIIIVTSIFLLPLSIILLINAAKNNFGERVLIMSVLFFLLGLGLFVWGIVLIVNHRRSLKARDMGVLSRCTVVNKKAIGQRGGGVVYHVTVMYSNQDGTENSLEHDVAVTEDFYVDVRVGDKLECMVYKDNCYLNPALPKHIVEVDEEF